jgi:3-hydroxybutyryl-CoA dehydrogenase
MTRPGQVPALGGMVVGVLGGGTMGSGIAHAFLCAGSLVRLAEVDEAAAASAEARVAAMVRRSAELGRLGRLASAEEGLGHLVVGSGLSGLAGCELVVEAVPEEPALKVSLLARLEEVVGPQAVIATNTSSLSVNELAAALRRPERFLGLHFFNPVPASQLVEVVWGAGTAPGLVEKARQWVEELGKTPVVVKDSPGFATSRLGVALGLEAIRALEEGVASAEDIDTAMVLGYKHPVGPLRLTDLVGLDVRLAIAEYLSSRLGARFEPPKLLREKVARGELGKKSGRGFYSWAE